MLTAILLALPLLAVRQTPAERPPPDPGVALATALDGVQARMRARDWKSVQKALAAVLAQFENTDAARGKLIEIEEIARLAAFWSSHPDPDPKLLISGEVGLLDRNADLVRLTYERGRTQDRNAKRAKFRPISVPAFASGPTKERAPFPDFEQYGELTVHPLQFNGPYTAELKGSIPARGGIAPAVVLVFDGEEVLRADFGDSVEVMRFRGEGEPESIPIDKSSGVAAGEEFKLEVNVADSSVTIRSKGRIVVQTSKPRSKFGWFGYLGGRQIAYVKLSGKTYGQWVDALVDAAVDQDRAAFDKTWDPRKVLPAWLYDVAGKAVRDEAAEQAAIDRVQKGFARDVGRQWSEYTKAGKWLEALATVDVPNDPKILPLTREWAKASALFQLDRLDEARTAARAVVAVEPGHYEMRLLATALDVRLDGGTAPLDTARALTRDFPASADARRLLVAALVRRGLHADALREAERGFAAGVDRAAMEKLVKQCRRAVSGPAWRSSNVFESEHYAVASDMDRATCVQMAKVLEETHAFLAGAIGPIAAGSPRMRVYVFSGKQAYADYCEDLLGDPMSRTLGLFSPELAQLLFWNVVDRAEFVQTARHESVHQYLNALVAEVPLWLNEGLAQYFETIAREKGRLAAGAVKTDARDLLRSLPPAAPWLPLEKLFEMERDHFYGPSAPIWYAYSWAVVHALAHGAPKDRAIFDGLLQRLARGVDGAVAVRESFQDVDLDALLERVRAHVREP